MKHIANALNKKPRIVYFLEHLFSFMERYFNHPRCDVGHARRHKTRNPWSRSYLTIPEQLQCKFNLSREGNDVATNLPQVETWFMEGKLEPGSHYVEVREDYADVIEKMDHYSARPAEARAIIAEANRFVDRFTNPLVEHAVSLLVPEKYLRLSGSMPL